METIKSENLYLEDFEMEDLDNIYKEIISINDYITKMSNLTLTYFRFLLKNNHKIDKIDYHNYKQFNNRYKIDNEISNDLINICYTMYLSHLQYYENKTQNMKLILTKK